MQGKPEIIDALNDVLTGELTAINQYFLHARMCENWGYQRLYEKIRAESIDEMKHADKLIARVLYLDGLPNVQRLGKINIGQTVPEQFKLDLELEKVALDKLNKAIDPVRQHGGQRHPRAVRGDPGVRGRARGLAGVPADLARPAGRRPVPGSADSQLRTGGGGARTSGLR